jgi:hypothetical protein
MYYYILLMVIIDVLDKYINNVFKHGTHRDKIKLRLMTFLSFKMFDGRNSKPALSLEIFLEHFYSLSVSIRIVFPL